MNEAKERWDKAHADMDMIVANDLLWTLDHAMNLAKRLPGDITWGWDLRMAKEQMERSIAYALTMPPAPPASAEPAPAPAAPEPDGSPGRPQSP